MRGTPSGCQCRVPLSDTYAPSGLMSEDLDAWAKLHKLTIAPDHMGRPSITLADAYRLREEVEKAEREVEAARAVAAAANNACHEVDRIYTEAYQAYARTHPQWRDEEIAAARVAGQEAAKAYLDTLPPEVGRRIQLPDFLPLAVS